MPPKNEKIYNIVVLRNLALTLEFTVKLQVFLVLSHSVDISHTPYFLLCLQMWGYDITVKIVLLSDYTCAYIFIYLCSVNIHESYRVKLMLWLIFVYASNLPTGFIFSFHTITITEDIKLRLFYFFWIFAIKCTFKYITQII